MQPHEKWCGCEECMKHKRGDRKDGAEVERKLDNGSVLQEVRKQGQEM